MVRVISEKLFSPPRSRHSSGETLDKELAARAVEALSSLESRRLDFFSDYESSSDSHWDSEADQDCDSQEGSLRAGQGEGSKTGAAGYRPEAKGETAGAQQAVCAGVQDATPGAVSETTEGTEHAGRGEHAAEADGGEPGVGAGQCSCGNASSSRLPARRPALLWPPAAPSPAFTFPSASTARPVGGICPSTHTSQRDDDDDEAGDDDDEGSGLGVGREAVDNDRMQLGNVAMVDNFLFNTRPSLTHSAAAMPSVPSTSLCFGVSTSGVVAAARPRIATTTTSTFPITTTIKDSATNIFSLAGANSNDTSTGVPLHHIPNYRQHANPFLNSDLNANTAGNTTTCNVRGTNQHLHNNNNSIIVLNDDMNNNDNASQFQQHRHNNSNMLLASSLGGGRKTKPACHSGHVL
ncbi:hypothetical protein C0Q70_14147 [Pomacea canaliculata]|uniref:Uncharacterized protein n=1 Tax=Pomacea canaliculata TaxID=400727 RepID=A0A2T7NZ84_POMCA|nr:hypothetical protein C0Q70_14147 [Pomacea canaliculata]